MMLGCFISHQTALRVRASAEKVSKKASRIIGRVSNFMGYDFIQSSAKFGHIQINDSRYSVPNSLDKYNGEAHTKTSGQCGTFSHRTNGIVCCAFVGLVCGDKIMVPKGASIVAICVYCVVQTGVIEDSTSYRCIKFEWDGFRWVLSPLDDINVCPLVDVLHPLRDESSLG